MKIYQLFLAIICLLLIAAPAFAQEEEASPSFLQTQETTQMNNLSLDDSE